MIRLLLFLTAFGASLAGILLAPQAHADGPEAFCGPGTYWNMATSSCLPQNPYNSYPYTSYGPPSYPASRGYFCFNGLFINACGGNY